MNSSLETGAKLSERYRGQWGGKIENGEEMWWTEPNYRLQSSAWERLKFRTDVRQSLILRFWNRVLRTERAERGSTAWNPKDWKIVDFGCGTAGTSLSFSQMMGVPFLGVDLFETQLEIAREFARKLGSDCTYQKLDAEGRIPLGDGALDALVSLDVLGHVPNIPATLQDWSRALRPGGWVLLFTEATYSPGDRSLMARLAREGVDMMLAVPEHISLLPREQLEAHFAESGLELVERFSANVGHFFFFPKDYWLLLRDRPGYRGLARAARAWDRVSKVLPFYPWPFQWLRGWATRVFGPEAFGTSYFYLLRKTHPRS